MDNTIEPPRNAGLLVTGDLIFSTKITGTARVLGLEVRVAGSPGSVVGRIRTESPQCILLDLSVSRLTPELIQEIVGAAAGKPVVAFGSHVDTARLQAARDAGCTAEPVKCRTARTAPAVSRRQVEECGRSASNRSDDRLASSD
jgi:DNA-binding NtrC family response regulator